MEENKKYKNLCIYHDDADGWTSAAIVKSVECYKDTTKFVKAQHGDDFTELMQDIGLHDYHTIFMVDFSLDKAKMDYIVKKSKIFCWIDHHKSAKEKLPELWDSNNIDGLRSTNKSGCMLTWQWFTPNEPAPEFIEYVNDYDIWKHEFPETKLFIEGFNIKFDKFEEILGYIQRGNVVNSLVSDLLDDGNILYKKKVKDCKKLFDKGLEIEWDGYKTLVVNIHDGYMASELGNYIVNNGYEIALMWTIKEKSANVSIISLRSKDDIDVSKIAKENGGGGHKNAAGFTTSIKKILELYEVN